MAGILVIWRLKPYPSLALLGRLCLAPRGGRRLPPFGGLPQGWKERLNLGKEMWMVLNSGVDWTCGGASQSSWLALPPPPPPAVLLSQEHGRLCGPCCPPSPWVLSVHLSLWSAPWFPVPWLRFLPRLHGTVSVVSLVTCPAPVLAAGGGGVRVPEPGGLVICESLFPSPSTRALPTPSILPSGSVPTGAVLLW